MAFSLLGKPLTSRLLRLRRPHYGLYGLELSNLKREATNARQSPNVSLDGVDRNAFGWWNLRRAHGGRKAWLSHCCTLLRQPRDPAGVYCQASHRLHISLRSPLGGDRSLQAARSSISPGQSALRGAA